MSKCPLVPVNDPVAYYASVPHGSLVERDRLVGDPCDLDLARFEVWEVFAAHQAWVNTTRQLAFSVGQGVFENDVGHVLDEAILQGVIGRLSAKSAPC